MDESSSGAVKTSLPLVLLPGVIGIYAVVHSLFFGRGLESLPVAGILLSTLIILAYAYLLVLLFRGRDSRLNFLTASLVLAITLFYGSFRDQVLVNPAIAAFVRNYFWNKNNTFFILIASLLFWIVLRLLRSRPESSGRTGKVLIIFVSALIIMDVGSYFRSRPTIRVVPPEHSDTIRIGSEKPDVYFLIFDSETSPNSLRRYWAYRTDSLDQKLRERGFFVGKQNRSNYNSTPYSIASTLNMSYLTGVSPEFFKEEFPQAITSGVMDIFAANGYSVHNLSFLTVNGHPKVGSVMQYSIWSKTLFYLLYDRIANYGFTSYRTLHTGLLKSTVDSLSSLIEEQNAPPKFVYAHVYVPHTPAFLDGEGNPKAAGVMDAQDMGGYLGQVVYSYKLMLRLVERIQERSHGHALIIIQGDHGYRFLEGPQKMDEQFDIFSAYYFPNKDYSLLNDSSCSVNAFRILFDSQFGARLPLLPYSSVNALTDLLKTMR
jgi:sulfatase-like protein